MIVCFTASSIYIMFLNVYLYEQKIHLHINSAMIFTVQAVDFFISQW